MTKYKVSYQENKKLKSKVFSAKEKLPDNIISIKKLNRLNLNMPIFNSKIKKSDLYNLLNEINIMLKSGLQLLEVLEISIDTYDKNSKIYEMINSMINALKNGTPIYKALNKYKDYIGAMPISFIKLGESQGNIKDSIDALCTVLEMESKNNKKIISKLQYPMILLVSLIMMMIAMFIFVIPEFTHIFIQLNTKLPTITLLLLKIKEFILNYGLYILIFIILFVLTSKIAYKNYDNFKYKTDKMLLEKIPLLSRLLFASNMYRFFLVLKVLVSSGYKLQVALVNSKITINNSYLLNKVETITKSIESGKDIGTSFEKADIFDPFTLRLLIAAQHSNILYGVLEKLEHVYYDRLNQSMNQLSKALEPLLVGLLGSIVLFIVLAVLLPMWEMNIILR